MMAVMMGILVVARGGDDVGGGALFVVDVVELSESLPMVQCSRLNHKAINHKLQLWGDNQPYE